MSIRFSIAKLLVLLLGSKRLTSLPCDKMLRRIRRTNKLNGFFIPEDEDFLYRDESITLAEVDGAQEVTETENIFSSAVNRISVAAKPQFAQRDFVSRLSAKERGALKPTATFHCLVISHKPQADRRKKRRGILCIYGGGMLLSPPRMFVGFAKDMAKETGLDVWFPYYPLCDRYTIRDSVHMVNKVYEAMCREYEEVCWYGYSSGGALLLLLGAYLNEIKSPLLPKVKKMILISPGGVPINEEEWQEMQGRDNLDFMLSARYLQTIQPLLKQGCKDIPAWMQTCQDADLSGLPETWIYYGTDEVLFAKAKFYDEILTKAGVLHHIKIAPGMPHCYCVTVFFPEAQDDYNETMRILTEE